MKFCDRFSLGGFKFRIGRVVINRTLEVLPLTRFSEPDIALILSPIVIVLVGFTTLDIPKTAQGFFVLVLSDPAHSLIQKTVKTLFQQLQSVQGAFDSSDLQF